MENVLPVMVLASIVLAGVATPFLPKHAGPLAIAQARRPRPDDDTISDAGQAQKITRSHTVAGNTARPRRKEGREGKKDSGNPGSQRPGSSKEEGPKQTKNSQMSSSATTKPFPGRDHRSLLNVQSTEARLSTSSLPDIRIHQDSRPPSPPRSAEVNGRPSDLLRRHSHIARARTPSTMPRDQKVRMLRSNYFHNETAFLTALQDISNRLVAVPKPARLSALRAELALIAQDLPTEVDIPLVCPAVLEDGMPARSKHHRIVRLNPAEATSLNSAERVPYLLMVEVLREDFDFDPDSEENQHLIAKLLAEKGTAKRRLFDLSDASRQPSREESPEPEKDSVLEPANGDLGASPLPKSFFHEQDLADLSTTNTLSLSTPPLKAYAARSSSGTNARSSLTAISTPRTSNTDISRSNSPGPRKMTMSGKDRAQGPDQPDISALATHMRAAAQMLAQLDQSGSKRPRAEVAAIKAKIIASMQDLEEQSFLMEDPNQPATFDTIMAKAASEGAEADTFNAALDAAAATTPTLNAGRGDARMENDEKTGGVRRQGDRDDPSAATFGEEWSAKKERIRKSSPFGWMKNWDLVSVIVKTGADLRQEAFACQLIRVCGKILETHNVPVWVKEMRILVTGESSGLIETITNGVSLHSLKRSLTLASIAANANPRKRIATLRDHFIKAFGEPDSESYAAAVDAFMRSLAAYSIICYVLQLKDRHNGNILIDNAGHMIHIDFGFMLSNSPGGMGFEAAPFKLTQEYIDVLGGLGSPQFEEFKQLCKASFQALRKEAEKIIMLVEVMGRESAMPCFASGVQTVVNSLRARFVLHLSREEAEGYVEELVQKSAGSYYTKL